jgi:hypothetical protein
VTLHCLDSPAASESRPTVIAAEAFSAEVGTGSAQKMRPNQGIQDMGRIDWEF